MKELIEAGVHFGHQKSRWNPKMKRYIFGEKAGVYIVDVEKTVQGLDEAKQFLRNVASEGGPILFVGTKRQAQPIIQEQAIRCNQFYINIRWLGGLLTNFLTIQKSLQRLRNIRMWREDGTFSRFTKKEAAHMEKELGKLEKNLGGILEMGRLPKAVFVVDAKHEETAIQEANRLGIPVVGLVDTNSNPDTVTYVIPGNDDSIRSIKLISTILADAILEGYQTYLVGKAAEQAAEEAKRAPKEKPAEAAVEVPSVEEALPDAAVPIIDEVEAIVPGAALKVVEEKASEVKKKKVIKVKEGLKSGEKGPSV